MRAELGAAAGVTPAAVPYHVTGLAEVRARLDAWLATATLVGVATSLFVAFVGYGYNLEDEGTLLYQILRTARGERPYLDFHTGYTPGVFYVNAALLKALGGTAIAVRWMLVLINTLAVGLIFRLALRLAPPLEAALAGLAYALFMPFFAGQFASFNIPYPAWYAGAAWLAAELASVRAVESGRRVYLCLAGAAAGLAFTFKPNTGVLALGAAALAQLLVSAPAAGRLGRALEGLLLALAMLGVVATLGSALLTPAFGLLAVPALALIVAAWLVRLRMRTGGETRATRPVGAALGDASCLLAGFVLVTGPWLAYFLPLLGADRFVHDVLLLGAGVERVYLLHYPRLTPWSALLVLGVIGAGISPALVRGGWLRLPSRRAGPMAVTVGVAAILVVLLVSLAEPRAPEGFAISVVLQLENASFFLFPVVLAGAVLAWIGRALAWTELAPGPLERSKAIPTVAIVYALLLFLQLYPRIDFMHVVISMSSALVVAAGALARAGRSWAIELGPTRAGGGAIAALSSRRVRQIACLPIAIALVLRVAPMVEARLALTPWPELRASTSLGGAPLPVAIERDRDHELRELRAVAAFVKQTTRPDAWVLSFPALAMVNFLTGRRTPSRHDYFFAGRPDHGEESEVVAAMEATRPHLVVTLNDRLGYFSAAPAYYFILRDHVQRNYRLVRRFGRYDVLLRRDLDAQAASSQAASSGARVPAALDSLHPPLAFARGGYRRALRESKRIAAVGRIEDLARLSDSLADVDRQIRRATISAALAVAARGGGLEVAARAIAPDQRSMLLWLRGLGEFAAESALPYVARVSQDLVLSWRIRREAGTAANYILARELASRFQLAQRGAGPLWSLPPELASGRLIEAFESFRERERIGPIAALSLAARDRRDQVAQITGLDDRRHSTWYRMVASYAVVKLGRREHLETLWQAINDGTPADQYVPAMMLDPELIAPADAIELVAARLRGEGTTRERETAAWMAPYLTSSSRDAIDPALAIAAGDPSPEVRVAAEWAIRRRAPAAPLGGVAGFPRGGAKGPSR